MYRYPWQESFIDGARELDVLYLSAKLEKADAAIRERMSALCEDGDPSEREALVEALKALQILRRGFDGD